MNKLRFFLKSQTAVWVLVVVVLAAGYYLRAYFYLNYHYDFSPYDAFWERHWINVFGISTDVDLFTLKSFSYPLSHILKAALGVFNQIYWLYFVGALTIFFLAKEFGNSVWAGILAFLVFTVAPENLIHYTKAISPAGLNYVLSWLSLLFLFKYLKQPKDLNLVGFIMAAVLAIMSYHTGASALVVILSGILLTILIKQDQIKTKLIGSFLVILGFYVFWIGMFDVGQISLIKDALLSVKLLIAAIVVLISVILLYWSQRIFVHRRFASPVWALGALGLAMFLVFSPFGIFNSLLSLGVDSYYSSATTLNNYLAQALIVHIYLVMLIPLWSKFDDARKIFVAGWLGGLAVVFFGLALENYYARIFDYSFPLMFVLFGYYWTGEKRLRASIVTLTVILLFVSELIIFNDPFSLRRYYKPEEVAAAQKIIDYGVGNHTISDLRTSALFYYLGESRVRFLDDYFHRIIFYEYQLIKPDIKDRKEKNIYLVIGESMKDIVYGINFQTTPLDQTFYDYFEENFNLYFDAGDFKVYQLK